MKDHGLDQQELKKAAAKKAFEYVKDGMRLGIGTGSTAEEFIKLLAERVREGFTVTGIPTSERSRLLCTKLGINLSDLDATPELDLTIDGADEFDKDLHLLKGGGGALLREKITAYASKKMVVIVDETKLVENLGKFPLPIEVNPFGLTTTKQAIKAKATALGLHGEIVLRQVQAEKGGEPLPFITDGGHYILDAHFEKIAEPEKLAHNLCNIAGVVEHGLFFHPNCSAVLAQKSGDIKIFGPNC